MSFKASSKLQARTSQALGNDYRRVRSVAESINSQCIVLRERRKSYEKELAMGVRSFENEKIQAKRAAQDLESLTTQFQEVERSYNNAVSDHDRIEENYNKQVDQRNELRKQIDAILAEQNALTYRSETIQSTLDSLKEELHDAQVELSSGGCASGRFSGAPYRARAEMRSASAPTRQS